MGKKFNTQAVTDKFFTQTTQETSETQTTQETQKKTGRPKERHDTYRFSLYLDGDLKDYIKFISWKQQKTVTQYLNDIIRAEMEAYIEAGGDESEWMKE